MSDPAFPPHDAMFRHDHADVHHTRLHYVTAGAGDPVLLWHGFLGTWYSWRKVIPLLAENYTVIAPDMRGFGDSDKPICDCDARTLCEDFRALTSKLGFQKLRIVAHDLGAPPALLWAALYPGEVEDLVYLDHPVLTAKTLNQIFQFTPEIMNQGLLWWWMTATAPDLAELLIKGREREFLTWFYRNHAMHPDAVDDALSEYLRTFAGAGGVSGSLGSLRAVFRSIQQTEDATAGKKIETPIMALGGEKSLGDRVRHMIEEVASNVTGGVITDCGHFIAEEQPELLVGRIRSFFETN